MDILALLAALPGAIMIGCILWGVFATGLEALRELRMDPEERPVHREDGLSRLMKEGP